MKRKSLFLPISLMSDLIEDSWTFRSASAFNSVRCYFGFWSALKKKLATHWYIARRKKKHSTLRVFSDNCRYSSLMLLKSSLLLGYDLNFTLWFARLPLQQLFSALCSHLLDSVMGALTNPPSPGFEASLLRSLPHCTSSRAAFT